MSKSNLGVGQRVGDFNDFSFLAAEHFEDFINQVEELSLTPEELDRLKGDDISLMEFNSSKEQLKSGFIFSQESVQSLMIFNGRNMLTYGRCISPSEVLQTIERITLDDINAIKYMIADYDSYSIINVTGKN